MSARRERVGPARRVAAALAWALAGPAPAVGAKGIDDGACDLESSDPGARLVFEAFGQHPDLYERRAGIRCHRGVPLLVGFDRQRGGFWVETRDGLLVWLVWNGHALEVRHWLIPDNQARWFREHDLPQRERDWWLDVGAEPERIARSERGGGPLTTGLRAMSAWSPSECRGACALEALAVYLPGIQESAPVGVNPYAYSWSDLDDLAASFPPVDDWKDRRTGDVVWIQGCDGVAVVVGPEQALVHLPGGGWGRKLIATEAVYLETLSCGCVGMEGRVHESALRTVRPYQSGVVAGLLEERGVFEVWDEVEEVERSGRTCGPNFTPDVTRRDEWYLRSEVARAGAGLFSDGTSGGALTRSTYDRGAVAGLGALRQLQRGDVGAIYAVFGAGLAHRGVTPRPLSATLDLGVEGQWVTGGLLTPRLQAGLLVEAGQADTLSLARYGGRLRLGLDAAPVRTGTRFQPGVWLEVDASRLNLCRTAARVDPRACHEQVYAAGLEALDPYWAGWSVWMVHPVAGVSLSMFVLNRGRRVSAALE